MRAIVLPDCRVSLGCEDEPLLLVIIIVVAFPTANEISSFGFLLVLLLFGYGGRC